MSDEFGWLTGCGCGLEREDKNMAQYFEVEEDLKP